MRVGEELPQTLFLCCGSCLADGGIRRGNWPTLVPQHSKQSPNLWALTRRPETSSFRTPQPADSPKLAHTAQVSNHCFPFATGFLTCGARRPRHAVSSSAKLEKIPTLNTHQIHPVGGIRSRRPSGSAPNRSPNRSLAPTAAAWPQLPQPRLFWLFLPGPERCEQWF